MSKSLIRVVLIESMCKLLSVSMLCTATKTCIDDIIQIALFQVFVVIEKHFYYLLANFS